MCGSHRPSYSEETGPFTFLDTYNTRGVLRSSSTACLSILKRMFGLVWSGKECRQFVWVSLEKGTNCGQEFFTICSEIYVVNRHFVEFRIKDEQNAGYVL